MIKSIVYEKEPTNFASKMDVAAAYCEHKERFLILKRHPGRPQGNLWGLPAGKLEPGELPIHCAIRELYEEAGVKLTEKDLTPLGRLYVKHPDWDFIFHIFYTHFDKEPQVILGLAEHLEARWLSFDEAIGLPLISGGHDALLYARKKIKALR